MTSMTSVDFFKECYVNILSSNIDFYCKDKKILW